MKIKNLVEAKYFQNFIIGIIVLNGIVLGFQTSNSLSPPVTSLLQFVDSVCLFIFVVELALKFSVYRFSFFKSGWNIFDFLVVVISLIPATGGLSILRAFRILRVLRLVTSIDSFRRVVSGMLMALPGVGSVAGLLMLLFYIAGVISTMLFGESFPDWFGTLGKSMFSLFQIMTLESWSMGIVRPIMEVYPYAWAFFIPFIAVTTFTVLNLFIGIVVDAMATVKENDQIDRGEPSTHELILELKREVSELKSVMQQSHE